ncbi:type IV pilin protein [uncultured Azonexus sp.]|uniref:type IV pilin protein n=1 Tax=uncultured Azonexus sp. TaxID=520307 RepID=UPI00261F35D1|nr:type IV pilin protein [uncultured Azonexus sp.]
MRNKCFSNQGFSLVELMVVVAIIGILMSVALPAYNSYITKARRTDAQRAMVEYSHVLERFYTASGRYATTAGGGTCGGTAPANPQLYALSCAVVGNVYTITATPSGAQAADGNMTLNSTGARTPTSKW